MAPGDRRRVSSISLARSPSAGSFTGSTRRTPSRSARERSVPTFGTARPLSRFERWPFEPSLRGEGQLLLRQPALHAQSSYAPTNRESQCVGLLAARHEADRRGRAACRRLSGQTSTRAAQWWPAFRQLAADPPRGVPMDKIVDKIVALGVPGLVLLVAIGTTGLAGGAAVVAALALARGPARHARWAGASWSDGPDFERGCEVWLPSDLRVGRQGVAEQGHVSRRNPVEDSTATRFRRT